MANLTKVSVKMIITPSNELRPKGFPFIRNKSREVKCKHRRKCHGTTVAPGILAAVFMVDPAALQCLKVLSLIQVSYRCRVSPLSSGRVPRLRWMVREWRCSYGSSSIAPQLPLAAGESRRLQGRRGSAQDRLLPARGRARVHHYDATEILDPSSNS